MNGDGIKDLIYGDCGSGYVGYIYLNYRNADGTLQKAEKMKVNGQEITGNLPGPEIIDWNEDGLLDLIVSHDRESTQLYLNTGTKEQYSFSSVETIKANGSSISFPRGKICIADLNLDGKKDIIVGTDEMYEYQLAYFENIGTNDKPAFGNFEKLTSNETVIKHDADALVFEVRLCVTDWNNDGAPDLIVGDNSNNTIQDPIPYIGIFLGKASTALMHNSVSLSKKPAITILPNNKTLSITVPERGVYHLTLYNILGKKVMRYTLHLHEGVNLVKRKSSVTGGGVYAIELSGKAGKIRQRLILGQ